LDSVRIKLHSMLQLKKNLLFRVHLETVYVKQSKNCGKLPLHQNLRGAF
jgi:hypothetical protein